MTSGFLGRPRKTLDILLHHRRSCPYVRRRHLYPQRFGHEERRCQVHGEDHGRIGIDCTITVPWEGISVNGTNANKTCQKPCRISRDVFKLRLVKPQLPRGMETVIRISRKDKGFVGIKPYYPKHGLTYWMRSTKSGTVCQQKKAFDAASYRILKHLSEDSEAVRNLSRHRYIIGHSGSSYPNADFMIDVAKDTKRLLGNNLYLLNSRYY